MFETLNRPLRLLYIVPSFYPAIYHGGPVISVYNQCNSLAEKGLELRVLTTDTAGLGRRLTVTRYPTIMPAGYPVYYCRRKFSVAGAPGIIRHMIPMMHWADVVHLVAVYSFPTIPVLAACKWLDKPVVWSPKGAFQRWEGSSKVALKAVWDLTCRIVKPRRLILHATSDVEATESSRRFPGVPVAISPNGVEVPETLHRTPSNGLLRLLYLGRLDRIKGIDNLLGACAQLNNGLQWNLTIAGTGEHDYREFLERRIKQLNLSNRVKMIGEVADTEKQDLFGSSDVLVFPSHQESFGMVAAEALARGLPIIASRHTPWKGVEEKQCGLWVDNDENSLAKAIKEVSTMPLSQMGARGREWMTREFSWKYLADEMVDLYHQVRSR